MADLAGSPLDDTLDDTDMSRKSSRRTVFRPCIDLHGGFVKQLVGGTLSDNPADLKTNFVATDSAASFAHLYRMNHLEGGHVIKLGPGNDQAAREALAAWPGISICFISIHVILTLVGAILCWTLNSRRFAGRRRNHRGKCSRMARSWCIQGTSRPSSFTLTNSLTIAHSFTLLLDHSHILPLSLCPLLSPTPTIPLPPCRPRQASGRRKVRTSSPPSTSG